MTDRPYHHGNLRAALVETGVEHARRAGPGALTIRDLARATGVSPSAAYRHFPDLDHLLAEVAQRAREELATALQCARDSRVGEGGDASLARFQAMGDAYLSFALREPNLFETAFMATSASPVHPDVPDAWHVLGEALDELVSLGLLDEARRARAPLTTWSIVHGLATILVRHAAPIVLESDDVRAVAADAIIGALRLDR